MRNRSQRAAPLAVAILLALSATTQAQDNQQAGQAESGVKELDKVVVTGSSIPRTDTETASPVQVITAAEIERSGKATVGEYLQTLTANGGGSIPKSFGNGFASGSSGISLRGSRNAWNACAAETPVTIARPAETSALAIWKSPASGR